MRRSASLSGVSSAACEPAAGPASTGRAGRSLRGGSAALAAAALGLLAACPAHVRADEPLLLAAGADFALPLTNSQFAHFLPGAEVSVALRVPFDPLLSASVRGFGGLLFDGPAPADPLRVDPGVGSWLGVGLGLRVRPPIGPSGPERATGLWCEAELAGVLTGLLVRPAFALAVGYGFDLGPVVLEPRLRLQHILQFEDPIDDGQALLLLAGLGGVFGERHATLEQEHGERDDDLDDDGILDPDDACVDVPEDFDEVDDADGCPETDADGDGVLDPDDGCVHDPEDADGIADADGCPETDADGDRILDPVDACPEQAEVLNGVEDTDGCPDVGLITLEGDRVILDDRVLFDTNRARVRHAARPVLAAIVQLFLGHPEWMTMRIEGHADEHGTEEFNRELSLRRARAVREVLVELGVPRERMEVEGYGESRPRSTVDTENRRVEFVMVEAPVTVPAPGGSP
jgi:outer membrane protein OmpA-like peptidoglycan-associated protein